MTQSLIEKLEAMNIGITAYKLMWLGIIRKAWVSPEDILTPFIHEEFNRVSEEKKKEPHHDQ